MMVPLDTSFYYAILGVSLGVLCLYLFGKLSRRLRFIWFVWIIWTLFSIIIPSVFIIIYYLTPPPESNLYYILWQLCAFLSMTSLSLYLYLLIIIDPDLYGYGWAKAIFFWVFLWIAIVLTNVYSPETVTSQELGAFVLRLPPYTLILVLISCIPIFQKGFRYLRKIWRHIRKNGAKSGITFFSGFTMLLCSYPLSFLLSSMVERSFFGAFFLGTLSIGGVCVGYALASNPRILFTIPKMVIEMSIFHKSGEKLLSLHLRSDYQSTELKQGIIIGLQGLLTDLLGNDIVQEIKLKDRHVILLYNQRLGYIVILATVQIHRIMKIFLQEFARVFEQHFQKELQEYLDINNPVDPEKFKSFEDLTRQLFAI